MANIPIDQLCSAIDELNTDEFQKLDQAMNKRRQKRLKEIVQKARNNAAKTPSAEISTIITKAIEEVRAENAAHGRT